MFINFGCFQGPYTTLHKGYLNGYLIHRKCLMLAVRLFVLPNFPGPTFISCLTSIPDSRVRMQCSAFTLTSINLVYRARIIALPRF